MKRRILGCFLLLTLVMASVNYRPAPVAAAPLAQGDNAALADYFPTDTVLYANVRTADLRTNIDTLMALAGKLGGAPMPDAFQQLDAGLTQFLGRSASLEKDVLPWLGDHVGIGFILSDADMNSLTTLMSGGGQNAKIVAVVEITDQAAGDAFLKETMTRVQTMDPVMKTNEMQVGGGTATVYASATYSILQAEGFLAIGTPAGITELVNVANTKPATLAADTGFVTTMGLLQPDNLSNLYISPRLYDGVFQLVGMMMGSSSGSAGQQMQALKNVFTAINGQAYGIHLDSKTLRLDVVQSFDGARLKTALQGVYGTSGTISSLARPALSATWADKVPGNALLTVALSGGLSEIYQQVKDYVSNASLLMGPAQASQAAKSFDQIEAMSKAMLDLDLQADVFSWMTGEVVFYVTYNPNSVLNTPTSSSSSAMPFDFTFLIKTGDPQKTTSFIQKLNTALPKMGGVTIKDMGDGFYTLGPKSGDGYYSYGLSSDTFVLTTSSGLAGTTAALKGTNALSASGAWTNARQGAPADSFAVGYVSMEQLVSTISAMTPANSTSSQSTQQMLTSLGSLESLAVSASITESSSAMSVQVKFK
jgi:hypothetical protein